MATFRSCATCEIVFNCICWLKSCILYMKQAVSWRCSIKRCSEKNSQNSQVNRRRSHSRVFCQKGALKDFSKFREKHLCWSLFFNKVTDWQLETVSSQWICSTKKVLLNFSQISHENICVEVSFNKAFMKKNKFNILKTILLKREPDTGAVKFAKFLRKPILKNVCKQSEKLLLNFT